MTMRRKINVLHLGNEMSWRGGENQIRLLIEGIEEFQRDGDHLSPSLIGGHLQPAAQIENFLAYPKNSQAVVEKRFSVTQLALPSRWPFDPRNVYALFNFCKRHQIDLLDCHSSKAHSLGLYLKNFLPKLKLVVHRHVDNLPTATLIKRSKYTSEKVDAFVAISAAIAQILKVNGVTSSKIHVVKSTVVDTGYSVKEKRESKIKLAKKLKIDLGLIHDSGFEKVSESTNELCFIGNASAFTWQKGHEVLIEACQILKERNIRFVCLLAGAGSEEDKYKAMVKQLGLDDQVRFVGFLKDVRPFLLALDILAAPSRNEGLGTILLEAAFSGAALVATNVGGIPEIIQAGVTGELVESEDASGLALALEKLIQNKTHRETLLSNCLGFITKKFSVRQMVEGNLEVYRSVMSS